MSSWSGERLDNSREEELKLGIVGTEGMDRGWQQVMLVLLLVVHRCVQRGKHRPDLPRSLSLRSSRDRRFGQPARGTRVNARVTRRFSTLRCFQNTRWRSSTTNRRLTLFAAPPRPSPLSAAIARVTARDTEASRETRHIVCRRKPARQKKITQRTSSQPSIRQQPTSHPARPSGAARCLP